MYIVVCVLAIDLVGTGTGQNIIWRKRVMVEKRNVHFWWKHITSFQMTRLDVERDFVR